MCSRNPWRTVRKGNKTLTYKPDCMCWGCDECRAKLKARWIAHAERCLQQGGYLGWLVIDIAEFERFAKKLRRIYGGKYARVRLNDSQYGVVVGLPINQYGWTFEAKAATPEEATQQFANWIDAIQDSNGGNPVSTSRDWSLPSREHSDWDLIAVGPAPSAVRSAAFLALADFIERTIHGTPVAICRGDTIQVDRLCELIGSLATRNSKAKERHHADSDDDVIGFALEDFQPCEDGRYSGWVLMT